MKLKVKCLGVDAGGKTVSIINKRDALELGVHPLDTIILKKGNRQISSAVNVSDKLVKPGSIIVYNEVQRILSLKNNDVIAVSAGETPASLKYIRKKIDGGELNYQEMKSIVRDVISRNLSDIELSSFITSLYIHKMTMNENYALSKSMIDTSLKVKFPGKIADKHSIGGVPGDKTSLLLVPIIASAGITIPKTSSRSITSPAGTADRMEILAPVEHGIDDIKRIVRKCSGCLVWGGAVDLAPADDLFIRIEHPLSIDPLLLPSVMSKKKVIGSKFVVIDIPTGSGVKIKTKEDAENLGRDFINLGKRFGIKVDCAVTRASQPVGYAMGPALEAREALENIMNIRKSPDLIDKVSSIAGVLLGMIAKGNKETALKILTCGKAEKKLRQIIKEQGGDPLIKPDDIEVGDYSVNILSKNSGIITEINNKYLADTAKIAGAPFDKKAGILLAKKIGDPVKKGETLYTIYAEQRRKMNKALPSEDAYTIASKNSNVLLERI